MHDRKYNEKLSDAEKAFLVELTAESEEAVEGAVPDSFRGYPVKVVPAFTDNPNPLGRMATDLSWESEETA